jgi:hypothetical protein
MCAAVPPAVPPAGLIRYGSAALADVLPSALGSLGVAAANPLGLAPSSCVVVLLVDGLGWNLLRANADCAPFLNALAGDSLTVGFPTTTATSLTSLGTGLPAGEHGVVGYTCRLQGVTEPINWLRWQGASSGTDLRDEAVPEEVQPSLTAFERATQAGVMVSVVSARSFQGSGLTRAALRGGAYVPVLTPADTIAGVAAAAALPRPGLVYGYLHELDLIGHVYGTDSPAWRVQLQLIDREIELLASLLPADAQLLVTADHGMVDVPDADKIDYDGEPALSDGVDMIAGEARVRYLYTGAADAVRDRWSERIGDRGVVLARDEVLDRGWFGPLVTEAARSRIGDLVVLATGRLAVVRRRAEPGLSTLIGQHGALTDDELLVPLLRLR